MDLSLTDEQRQLDWRTQVACLVAGAKGYGIRASNDRTLASAILDGIETEDDVSTIDIGEEIGSLYKRGLIDYSYESNRGADCVMVLATKHLHEHLEGLSRV